MAKGFWVGETAIAKREASDSTHWYWFFKQSKKVIPIITDEQEVSTDNNKKLNLNNKIETLKKSMEESNLIVYNQDFGITQDGDVVALETDRIQFKPREK